jgi:hypothetical protein
MSDNNLQLQYANQSMHYTTQFIASMTGEEVVLDCGSVLVAGAQAGQQQLPIHTRMALPWTAVHRLHRLLGQLIESHDSATQGRQPARATLPPFSQGGASSELAISPQVQRPT